MNITKHTLLDEDAKLFASMKGHYKSASEENFFKNMQYKEEFEATALNDLLVSEYENEDEIYIVRMYNEEYLVGHGINSNGANEVHLMCLKDALLVNLRELGLPGKNLSVWEWLRESDYAFVNYERNYDILENGKRR